MENNEQPDILIAEDNDGHARLLQLYLARAGLRTPETRFRDGVGVWDFITGKSSPCLQPDRSYLLLLDLRMPGMDGLEVLRRLKTAPPLKNLRVIAVSTSDDPDDLRLCRELGCASFLAKPLDADKLAALLK